MSTMASYCFKVQPCTLMAFSGQTATQAPQPRHRAGLTWARLTFWPVHLLLHQGQGPFRQAGRNTGAGAGAFAEIHFRHKGVQLHKAPGQDRPRP